MRIRNANIRSLNKWQTSNLHESVVVYKSSLINKLKEFNTYCN